MKKSQIILVLCFVVIILAIIILAIFLPHNQEKDITDTKTIIITKISYDANTDSEEIKITDEDKINEIIKIIQAKTEMPEGTTIPYGHPHYKIELLDKKDNLITEISLYYYSSDSTWITFKGEDTNYIIDSDALLKLLNL